MFSLEQFDGVEGAIAVRASAPGFDEGGSEYRAHEDLLRRKYRSWRGRSGRAYMFSVYSPFDCPAYEDAVLIVASRGGRRVQLRIRHQHLVESFGLRNQRFRCGARRGRTHASVPTCMTSSIRRLRSPHRSARTWM